jgi:hypoxanthine phosphoribosyltransferase
MNKEYITWNLYDHKVKGLIKQIDESTFKPDIVVGIMRGGMIPAVMISHHFEVPCWSVPLSYRDNVAAGNDLNQVWGTLVLNGGKNILFVEDIVDSGKTMSSLQNFINTSLELHWCYTPPQPTIKYASVWFNVGQETNVDYFSIPFDRNNNKDWFVFPYEKQ